MDENEKRDARLKNRERMTGGLYRSLVRKKRQGDESDNWTGRRGKKDGNSHAE